MKLLGFEIIEPIVSFFHTIRNAIPIEYLFFIFIGIEILSVVVLAVVTNFVYELRLMRAVDKINLYLYNVQYIDESNLIEFNNKMKKVPKTLRYHWQQFMLYREKAPSHYMSVENCIDRPIKSSSFESNVKVMKYLGLIYGLLAFIFSCGWASGTGVVTTDYFITIFTIPLFVLFINYIFLIGLNIKKSSSTSDLYQTFHIFNRFIDKAVATLPEYVDFEVLFTRKEIKRGIPVLNEYIEKRQIQEQEEMRRARENAVQHEQYNFKMAGEKGELVLERAMKEAETIISLRNRLNEEIDHFEKEIESCKRSYDNTTKDYQKKIQASKENIERLREQQESTTNRIESNYIRKQQSDEIKKQQQIEKEQDDATLRFNQEINAFKAEIKKRKAEIEGSKIDVEKAMFAEYKTFANKLFNEVKDSVKQKIKDERTELVNSREVVAQELEEALLKVDQLEKQNKMLVTKSAEKEEYIKAELGKENQKLIEMLSNKENIIIEEKEQNIPPISEKSDKKQKNKADGRATVIEGEFSFDDDKKIDDKKDEVKVKPDKKIDLKSLKIHSTELTGEYDAQGNYRFPNGTYYDPQGNFHDENGNIFDINGTLTNQGALDLDKPKTETLSKIDDNIFDLFEFDESFDNFDIEEEASEESKADEAAPRKPGRPRKLVEEEVTNEPKRGRGRPRKVVEEVAVTAEPKRGRGRPRKVVEAPVAEVTPTRKPGRPRKEESNSSESKKVQEKVDETSSAPKRGRGRPRKNPVDDELKEIELKIKKQKDLLKEQYKALETTVKKDDDKPN